MNTTIRDELEICLTRAESATPAELEELMKKYLHLDKILNDAGLNSADANVDDITAFLDAQCDMDELYADTSETDEKYDARMRSYNE